MTADLSALDIERTLDGDRVCAADVCDQSRHSGIAASRDAGDAN